MLLTENEVQASIEQARTAFPRFDNWQYNNEENADYTGFSLWGEFEIVDDESQVPALPRTYFVTFDTYQKTWRGHLTIGQPSYFWTSADVGDAMLFDTKGCDTLEDAIAAFKAGLLDLFRVFSVI